MGLNLRRIKTFARFTARSVARWQSPLSWKSADGALRSLSNTVSNEQNIERLQMVITAFRVAILADAKKKEGHNG
jgi:hypothetical protein